jgi:ribosome maturation factor RimP
MSSTRPDEAAAPGSPGQLRGVLEPLVVAAGFELDQLDVKAAGRRHTVRVVVDSDAGVDLDDIAELSRAVSAELDENEHLIGGAYTLEITSPGVDRPLTGPRHWRRAHLRQVAVRTTGDEEFVGRVGAVGAEAVTLLVGGGLRELRYTDVAHAGVQVEFRPAPEAEVRLLSTDARPAGGPSEEGTA